MSISLFEKIPEKHTALAQFLTAFRRECHQYPELSNQEFETTARIRKILEQHQIEILDLPLKTGLVAIIRGSKTGKTIALRSDIDALPIIEEAEVDYPSRNAGVMHACGHDFHLSAALGAAILLQQQREQLKGNIKIIFQPAEEIGMGAGQVLETGALDDVDVIFGLHNDPTLPIGELGTKPGALTAAVDRFEINIQGKGAHAARPQDGNDPIIILGQLISAVQSIISRNRPTKENAVVSITQVHSGTTWNVIPDTAYLEGTVRTFNAEVRQLLERRLRTIIVGLAQAFEAEIEFIWHAGCPSVMNAAEWIDFVLAQGESVGFKTNIVEASPIGEDFASYQEKIPGVFVMVGSGGPYALHHPKFKVDDKALFPTAYYLAELAKNGLEKFAS